MPLPVTDMTEWETPTHDVFGVSLGTKSTAFTLFLRPSFIHTLLRVLVLKQACVLQRACGKLVLFFLVGETKQR